jgi:cytochrome c oxidase subunit I
VLLPFFSLMSFLIAVPTGVKFFNWIGTMWKGQLTFETPMLWALGFVTTFLFGGLSGVLLASPPLDFHITDTYFIVAHFHYVLVGGSIMGIFAGIYHYYPKIFGRLMDEKLGVIHFWLTFVAVNLTFFPMHFSGMLGMPRRIYTYDAGQGWDLYNGMSSAGAAIWPIAMLVFIYNFFKSRKSGEIAGPNPWGAGTLEWTIPSPPPDYNFAKIPTVTSRYPLWEGKEADHESARFNVQEGKTAADFGILMPYNTIKPLLVALGMVIMFSGLITTRALIGVGAAILVFSLYSWLLSPLEPEHH